MSQPFPDAALDDRLGFVGTAGSGKSYTAMGRVALCWPLLWRLTRTALCGMPSARPPDSSGPTRDAYIQRLTARELVSTDTGSVRASDNLF